MSSRCRAADYEISVLDVFDDVHGYGIRDGGLLLDIKANREQPWSLGRSSWSDLRIVRWLQKGLQESRNWAVPQSMLSDRMDIRFLD